MKICSKCKVEKNDSEYYTYYHSTHKKHYTRNVCQDCMRKQAKQVKLRIKERKQRLKDERKEMIELLAQQNKVSTIVPNAIVEDFSSNPDHKKCTACNKYKSLNDFYQNKQSGYYHSRCKPCHNEYTNNKLTDYYQTKYRTRGGSERVMHKAGEFVDIYQEEQTAWLLTLIGWSKDGDVWVKKGIKTVQNGQIVWDKVTPIPKVKKERKAPKPKRVYDVEKIVELRGMGLTLLEIGGIIGCSKPTVRKILINEEAKRNG